MASSRPAGSTQTIALSQRHRPRRKRQYPRIITPSSSLSSILAFAVSTVDGSPLTSPDTPPPFLCPFIEEGCITPGTPTRRFPFHAPHQLPTDLPSKRSTIPPKYTLGPDGNWHRVEEYTLYGSTICYVSVGVHHLDLYAILKPLPNRTVIPRLPPPRWVLQQQRSRHPPWTQTRTTSLINCPRAGSQQAAAARRTPHSSSACH
jgi:hypothetical protein